jgi:hypothetical protein
MSRVAQDSNPEPPLWSAILPSAPSLMLRPMNQYVAQSSLVLPASTPFDERLDGRPWL